MPLTSSFVAPGPIPMWPCGPTSTKAGLPLASPPHLLSASGCPPVLSSLPPPAVPAPSPPPILQLLPYTPLLCFIPTNCTPRPTASSTPMPCGPVPWAPVDGAESTEQETDTMSIGTASNLGPEHGSQRKKGGKAEWGGPKRACGLCNRLVWRG